jgi:HEAT repeat protein
VVPEQDQAEQAKAILLRQLSIGLGVCRLFPDDMDRPAVAAAVDRIRVAAEQALASGPLRVEIRGERFYTADGSPLGDDEFLQRLALACYERRVEQLAVSEIPDAQALLMLHRALSVAVEDVDENQGLGAVLREGGVTSIVLGELGPPTSDSVARRLEDMPVEEVQVWERLGDPGGLASELVESAMGISSNVDGQTIEEEFRKLLDKLPKDHPRPVELYERIQEVILELPPDLRRKLVATLVDKVKGDPLAQRILGTMNDADLARALVDLARDGLDPVDAARKVTEGSGWRSDLVDLIQALTRGQEEAGTILAGLENVGIEIDDQYWEDSMSVLETVSDLLAREIQAKEFEDLRSVREEFPDIEEEGDALALQSFGDYLQLEQDDERLAAVLRPWADEAEDAMQRQDERRLVPLIAPLDRARAHTAVAEGRGKIDASMRQVVDNTLRAALIRPETMHDTSARLFEPFGGVAVDALFDMLADEVSQTGRAMLLSLLRELAAGHPEQIALRLADPRWFVVRNALHVLYRCTGRNAVPYLIEASRHTVPAVRREAIAGLVSAGGDEAVPVLQRMALEDADNGVRGAAVLALGGLLMPPAVKALADVARRASNVSVRKLAIDQLSSHPGSDTADALHQLASRRTRPRLPRALRRYAKIAWQKRTEGGR